MYELGFSELTLRQQKAPGVARSRLSRLRPLRHQLRRRRSPQRSLQHLPNASRSTPRRLPTAQLTRWAKSSHSRASRYESRKSIPIGPLTTNPQNNSKARKSMQTVPAICNRSVCVNPHHAFPHGYGLNWTLAILSHDFRQERDQPTSCVMLVGAAEDPHNPREAVLHFLQHVPPRRGMERCLGRSLYHFRQ
jgi:hypothetical protein